MIDIVHRHFGQWAEPEGPFRLDSAAGSPSPWSVWSYAPSPPILHLEGGAAGAVLSSAAGIVRRWDDPLEALAFLEQTLNEPRAAGPPFKGGWIGYLSYDLGRLFERIPTRAADDLCFPLFEFTYHPGVVAFVDQNPGPRAPSAPSGRRLRATQSKIQNPKSKIAGAPSGRRLRELSSCILHPSSFPSQAPSPEPRVSDAYAITCSHDFDPAPIHFPDRYVPTPAPLQSNFTRDAYERAVQRCLDYIAAGDVFQVNLSQRFTAGLPRHPREIYDLLRRRWPAWFGARLDYGDHALLCNSPELFFRIAPDVSGRRTILTRPIKGTRPLGAGMADELRRSVKDQAELNMIIDLERNDLGRVCEIGSVRVAEPRTIETHPTLHHGAATVEGRLRAGVTFVDLLRAVFPGGSITGAPEIRAMQIVEELEPHRRGPYCGAIGYFSTDRHIQFNIAIRTMLIERTKLHIPVGGGIVADSLPAAEYEETLVKAQAMFGAIGADYQ